MSGGFKEWLQSEGLSERTLDIIYHSIAMRDIGEDVDAEEGFEHLNLYLKSIGRYKSDSGPFMVPNFGCSDIPQVSTCLKRVIYLVFMLTDAIEVLYLSRDITQV